MTKKEARKLFKQKRERISSEEISCLSSQIFQQWKNSPLSSFNSYHIFLSIKEKKEIDTSLFIDFLWDNQKKVYCFKVNENILSHYELTPETELVKNSWGIPEPSNQNPIDLSSVDCVLVPLLAYDISGNRVGYGKGYYDRFLHNFPDSKKIGLSFFPPVSQIKDTCVFDIPLDYIITPEYYSAFPIEEK